MVVTADWKEVRLGDLGMCLRGVSYKGDSDLSDGDTPTTVRLLRSNNVQNSLIQFNDVQYVNHDCVSDEQILRRDDIVICMANGSKVLVGKTGLYKDSQDARYTFGAFMGCFRSSSDQAHAIFVRYLFLTKQYQDYISNLLAGSSINNLTPKSIESLLFNVPPLKEQEAIAEALSDADAAIESLDALIAKKRDVKQATMQQLLTGRTRLPGFTADWIGVRLRDLGSTFGGLTGKSSKDFGEGNASFVTFMNVMSNVVLNNQGTEKVRIGNGERQSQLLEGDVIFNGSSETPEEVGFGSAVPIELSGLYLNSFCFGFRRKDTKSLDPKFFAYLTRSPLGRDIIRPMAQGSTRYNIAKTNLLNGRFPLPPLKEQEAIAEALTVMDEELEALTQQISKLRMVKEGMMQDLLTGKVRLV